MKGRHGRTFALLAAIALVATACAWGQAGGNAARNGANPFEPGLTTGNVGRLQLAWQTNQSSGEPVMNAKYVYAVDPFGYVNAYAADGPSSALGAPHCTGSPVTCTPVWKSRLSAFASLSDPVVDAEQVFASANVNGHWTLFALNADPPDCPDTINGCEPGWTGQWGAPDGPQGLPSIAVADGRVYVSTPPDATDTEAHVAVFDERGVAGCTPAPLRTCTPLFQVATPRALLTAPSIAVVGGHLFVESTNATLAFDSAGQAGCVSGTCAPLFQLATAAARGVSLSGTTAYAITGTTLMAFDATGAKNCGGTPRSCAPEWTAALSERVDTERPAISGGKVLVTEFGDTGSSAGLEVFDAAGIRGCTGTPLACAPLWGVARGSMAGVTNHVSATPTLIVMSGWSVVPGPPTLLTQTVKTFDLAGTTDCSGVPTRCLPLSTTSVGNDIGISSPAVAFGRIAVTDTPGHLKVFSVAG